MRILALPAFKNRGENPYTSSLYTALQAIPGVTVAEFSNRRLLLECWDILHIHWADASLHRPTAFGAAFYCILFILRVLWAKLLGAKIVWTVHNLRSHQTASTAVENWLWRAYIPLVDSCIHLSDAGRGLSLESFPGLASKDHTVVPHGHYRGSYPNETDRLQSRALLGIYTPGPVIAFVGQIKAYKNVPALVDAFIAAAHPTALLLIAGRCGDSAIEANLRATAQDHPRILFRFGLIPEHHMHLYFNACDLAVFPYRDILNSGSAILALSFNRPALVPARGAMAELRQLAGPDWVYTYEGMLTGAALSSALDQATSRFHPLECNLAALDWPALASRTLDVYAAAIRGGTPAADRETVLAAPAQIP